MTINLETESIPTVPEQLSRENTNMTWVEYALYLLNHKDMSFTEEQCLLIAGKSIENYDVVDFEEKRHILLNICAMN